jgi:hypothetical protein
MTKRKEKKKKKKEWGNATLTDWKKTTVVIRDCMYMIK